MQKNEALLLAVTELRTVANELARRKGPAADERIERIDVAISRLRALMVERDESAKALGELLAVIHRDGGQFQAARGTAAAVQEAITVVGAERTEARDLKAEDKSRDEAVRMLRIELEGLRRDAQDRRAIDDCNKLAG
jgi:hypothetical protein